MLGRSRLMYGRRASGSTSHYVNRKTTNGPIARDDVAGSTKLRRRLGPDLQLKQILPWLRDFLLGEHDNMKRHLMTTDLILVIRL